jgi:hydroxymethylglutaryl-CoA reductase (NADPH)
MPIPSLLLKQLYTFGSLENVDTGVKFSIKNRLSDAQLTELIAVKIDGQEISKKAIRLLLDDSAPLDPGEVSAAHPLDFPLRRKMDLELAIDPLEEGVQQTLRQVEAKG